MRILLYSPDNGVTQNFMPHLWMFLLQSLTPPGHEVVLIDGNAQPMDEAGIARYVRENNIGLGRHRRHDAHDREGLPHGRRRARRRRAGGDGRAARHGNARRSARPERGQRHADAVALGEADETWPKIVADAARGQLKEIYAPVDEVRPGAQAKPSGLSGDSVGFARPRPIQRRSEIRRRRCCKRFGDGWGTFRIIPVESGRGCPYGCEFCTVTGFFGDSIRFRTNKSVVDELLLLKARAKREAARSPSFSSTIISPSIPSARNPCCATSSPPSAQVHWVAQISANLLRDEELVDLIAASGGKWIFIGMESIDPANLADVNKGFNKPGEYAAVLQRLADRNVFAITSFMFGMDNDTAGVAERTLEQIRTWPAGLPDFRIDHSAALHAALREAGGGGAPDAAQALGGVHTLCDGAHAAENEHRGSSRRGEVRLGAGLQPGGDRAGRASLQPQAAGYRINILVARLCFRGIYFPQMGPGVDESDR